MEENTKKQDVLEATEAEEVAEVAADVKAEDTDAPLDKNLKLMSPTRMVVRRFFRSKLSIIGLTMVIGLFLFSFLGPVLIADRTADYTPMIKSGAKSSLTKAEQPNTQLQRQHML